MPGTLDADRSAAAANLVAAAPNVDGSRFTTGATAARLPSAGSARSARTLPRIAAVVHERFGVGYTLPGLDLLLHRLGWSVQVPARQAAERNEEQIAAWREETWPQIKRPRRTWAPGWSSKTSPARG